MIQDYVQDENFSQIGSGESSISPLFNLKKSVKNIFY